jgi:alkylation response protein AidB-like acyl-CoA dehydrogenase
MTWGDLEADQLTMFHPDWLSDTNGATSTAPAALFCANYLVGEAVARITRTALTLGGAHALFKASPPGRLFRDGASAPIMPPSSDACLASLGIIGLGLGRTMSCDR